MKTSSFANSPLLTGRILRFLPLLAILLATFAVYGSSLGHDFLTGWDDPAYVTDNEAIRGITFENLKTAFTSIYVGNYAPIQIISYMIDYSLWGLKPFGFILTNLLLHAGSGIFLYLILEHLYGKNIWIFFATLIFLLHPVQVETVVWVSQRKTLLAMFFFLPSWYWYMRYRETPSGGTAHYAMSLGAFTLALLAKSVAVILPPLLLLFNLSFKDRQKRSAAPYDLLPYILLAGGVALLALKSQNVEYDGGREFHHLGNSRYTTLLTMLPVLARYLGMLFMPINLSAWYSPAVRTVMDAQVAWSIALSVMLLAVGLILWVRKRDLFFWYAVFFLGLVPVSQIVPLITLMNDRYMYFPMLGAAPFVSSLLYGMTVRQGLTNSGRRNVYVIIFTVMVGLCGMTSLKRADVWKDSVTLWTDAAAKCPDADTVHNGLGFALLAAGRVDEAIKELWLALKLNPNTAETWNQLGAAYGRIGDYDKAVYAFETVLLLDPNSEIGRRNLSEANAKKMQPPRK